jgi:hypothetical protein
MLGWPAVERKNSSTTKARVDNILQCTLCAEYGDHVTSAQLALLSYRSG